MKNSIQKFEPMLEIITKNHGSYFTSAKNKVELFKQMNDNRFVEIEGSIISVFEIQIVCTPKTPPRKKDADGIYYN